jgi:hypothetical protein
LGSVHWRGNSRWLLYFVVVVVVAVEFVRYGDVGPLPCCFMMVASLIPCPPGNICETAKLSCFDGTRVPITNAAASSIRFAGIGTTSGFTKVSGASFEMEVPQSLRPYPPHNLARPSHGVVVTLVHVGPIFVVSLCKLAI